LAEYEIAVETSNGVFWVFAMKKGFGTLLLIFLVGCAKPAPVVVFAGPPPTDEIFTTERIADVDYVRDRIADGLSLQAKNDQTTNQDYLLCYAVRQGANATVTLLLDSGAQVDIRSSGLNKTPLFQAAYDGRVEIMRLLIERGANVNAVDLLGNNPLREAISSKNLQAVQLLLDAGCDPKHVNQDGKSMLDIANQYGSKEIQARIARQVSNK
jgi:ankyrin repeat protein